MQKQMMQKRSFFNGVPLSFFYINIAELNPITRNWTGSLQVLSHRMSDSFRALSYFILKTEEQTNKGLHANKTLRIQDQVCVELFNIVLGRKPSEDGL